MEQRRFEYATRTAGGITVHPISKQIKYRHDNGTGAIETSFAFTWHTGTVQVEQRTTTLPAVATSQNGSGTSTSRKDVFDDHGYLIWSMDERGFITHHQYDLPTGAVVQRIDDVDTGVVSGAPSGWSTRSGGGLNLVTDYEIDDLGRHTEGLGPTHTIDLGGTATAVRSATWTVRKDGEHEVWVGRGYATGTRISRDTSTIARRTSPIQPGSRGGAERSNTSMNIRITGLGRFHRAPQFRFRAPRSGTLRH